MSDVGPIILPPSAQLLRRLSSYKVSQIAIATIKDYNQNRGKNSDKIYDRFAYVYVHSPLLVNGRK